MRLCFAPVQLILAWLACVRSMSVFHDNNQISADIASTYSHNGYRVANISHGEVIGLQYVHGILSAAEVEKFLGLCSDRNGYSRSPQRAGVGGTDASVGGTGGTSHMLSNTQDASKMEFMDANGVTTSHLGRISSTCPLIWPLMYLPRMAEARAKGLTPALEDEIRFTYNIMRKLATFLHVDIARIEPLQIIRYEEGQYYRQHHDHGKFYNVQTEQRSQTLLIFLSTLASDSGGETYFQELDVKVRPVLGDGVVWRNAELGEPLREAVHEALPVVGQVKYAINVWVAEECIPPFVDGFHWTDGSEEEL